MLPAQSLALTAIFSALSDPTRRAILERLSAQQEMTVGDLAEPLEMSLPAASKHLKVLERAGLLNRRRDGQRYYMKLNAAPLKSAADWIKYYERFWSESFDRLDDFLEQRSKNDEK